MFVLFNDVNQALIYMYICNRSRSRTNDATYTIRRTCISRRSDLTWWYFLNESKKKKSSTNKGRATYCGWTILSGKYTGSTWNKLWVNSWDKISHWLYAYCINLSVISLSPASRADRIWSHATSEMNTTVFFTTVTKWYMILRSFIWQMSSVHNFI